MQNKKYTTIKRISLLTLTFLLIQCTNPAKDKVTSEKPNSKDSCSINDTTNNKDAISLQSEITCPKCGYKKTETMPTDVCLIKYTCEKCKAELMPKTGDCCVFCTYGTHKCPSMQ